MFALTLADASNAKDNVRTRKAITNYELRTQINANSANQRKGKLVFLVINLCNLCVMS